MELPFRPYEERSLPGRPDASPPPPPLSSSVPRRKPAPLAAYNGARLSQAPSTSINVTHATENYLPEASSGQLVDGSSSSSTLAQAGPYSQLNVTDAGDVPDPSHTYSPVLHPLQSPVPRPLARNSEDMAQPLHAGIAPYADVRSDSPTYAPVSLNENGVKSQQESTDSMESSLQLDDQKPPPPPPHQLPVNSIISHRESLDGRRSARSESPASVSLTENAASRRHLSPAGIPAGGRMSFAPSPSHMREASRSRGHSPMSSHGSPVYPPRPQSVYSGHSPDSRPTSYVDLLNTSYPQQAPTPASFDNSHLRNAIGSNASLLSHKQTLEMYRANAKKTNDASILYNFAVFLVNTAQDSRFATPDDENTAPRSPASPHHPAQRGPDSPRDDNQAPLASRSELLREARQILQRLADRSPFAQYYLADGYASGVFNKGKEDYDRAFPLFLSASKHGHAESGYRAGLCYEHGWGCRKDPAKAVQFYRQSASRNHPGAMTRLGLAYLYGDLGLTKRQRDAVRWLRRATDAVDPQHNSGPYELAVLHETGSTDEAFQDHDYAFQLYSLAAENGHVGAHCRLGRAYEYGELGRPMDAVASVQYYAYAANHGDPDAMMALCAWYMLGAEPAIERNESEAFEWAKRAAELGNSSCRRTHVPAIQLHFPSFLFRFVVVTFSPSNAAKLRIIVQECPRLNSLSDTSPRTESVAAAIPKKRSHGTPKLQVKATKGPRIASRQSKPLLPVRAAQTRSAKTGRTSGHALLCNRWDGIWRLVFCRG